jgi:alcohol dehydrogenase
MAFGGSSSGRDQTVRSGGSQELRKFFAPEFVFGAGALSLGGQYARNLGGRHVLVVSDPTVEAAGWVQPVLASVEEAGLGFTLFKQVTPNPRIEEAVAGAAVFAENGCDAVIAVGGGSVIDCAKGIGLLVSSGGNILNFVGVDNVHAPMPPTICIPTTAGTSADVSQFAVITSRQTMRKMLIISKAVLPDIALIDPVTLTTMDPFLTACTGLDALVHAIEAYVSSGHSPLTDIHALEAMRLINANLLKSVAEPANLDYRTAMMLGSLEAGLAFSNASLGAVHAMAHSIGGLLDLPHGECNAMLFERVIDFNFPAAEDRYRNIAEAFGIEVKGRSASELRRQLVGHLRQLREKAGLAQTLSDSGVHRTEVRELSEIALDDPCIVTNPRVPCRRDIEVIYEECL